MSAVVFDLLQARRLRNPTALTPAQQAARHVHQYGVRIQAPGDLVHKACDLVSDWLACGDQMHVAIDRAECWLRSSFRFREHYTPPPPSAA